ncbi:MAG: MFS transporter, partial [Sphingomonadales bacterium]
MATDQPSLKPNAPTLPPGPTSGESPVSLWAPLKRPIYRSLWIASFMSMTGVWMHDAAASWLMTTIAPSPAMVALA